jgi:predicted membrane protein
MNEDIKYTNTPQSGKAIAGVILLMLGLALLIKQFEFTFLPQWLFSWPMGMIVLGFFLGARNNFKKSSSVIVIILGCIFLINENVDHADRFLWPIGIILFGLWLILRRNHQFENGKWAKYFGYKGNTPNPEEPVVDYTFSSTTQSNTTSNPFTRNGDDYLNVVSVFGGVKKIILSKDFKGGEVVNIFGGVDIDFTQAEINGQVIVDITQIFGGIKIIVPSHWKVVSDLAAVFSGLEDKRIRNTAIPNTDKILILKGVSIFAGIDIRSY